MKTCEPIHDMSSSFHIPSSPAFAILARGFQKFPAIRDTCSGEGQAPSRLYVLEAKTNRVGYLKSECLFVQIRRFRMSRRLSEVTLGSKGV